VVTGPRYTFLKRIERLVWVLLGITFFGLVLTPFVAIYVLGGWVWVGLTVGIGASILAVFGGALFVIIRIWGKEYY
jgi:hypothetical protein